MSGRSTCGVGGCACAWAAGFGPCNATVARVVCWRRLLLVCVARVAAVCGAEMIATEQQMKDARIDPAWRDYCAHLLIPLNKCRHETYYLPWKCNHERHEYERCQYGEYVSHGCAACLRPLAVACRHPPSPRHWCTHALTCVRLCARCVHQAPAFGSSKEERWILTTVQTIAARAVVGVCVSRLR